MRRRRGVWSARASWFAACALLVLALRAVACVCSPSSSSLIERCLRGAHADHDSTAALSRALRDAGVRALRAGDHSLARACLAAYTDDVPRGPGVHDGEALFTRAELAQQAASGTPTDTPARELFVRAAEAFERGGRWGDASRALVRAAPLLGAAAGAWRRLALMQRAIDDAARDDDARAIHACALWNAAGLAALSAAAASDAPPTATSMCTGGDDCVRAAANLLALGVHHEPSCAEALTNLAHAYTLLRRVDAARAALVRATSLAPLLAAAADRLVHLELAAQRPIDAAAIALRAVRRASQALRAAPPGAWHRAQYAALLGTAASAWEAAFGAGAIATPLRMLLHAIRFDPDTSTTFVNAIRAARMSGAQWAALRLARVAFARFRPVPPEILSHTGDVLLDMSLHRPSAAAYSAAVQRFGDDASRVPEYTLCNMLFALQTSCQWSHRRYVPELLRERVAHQVDARRPVEPGEYECVMPLQSMLYHALPARDALAIARRHATRVEREAGAAAQVYGAAFVRALQRGAPAFRGPLRRVRRPLAAAYVSADMRTHPMSHLMQDVFGRHAAVNATIVSIGASDGSRPRQRIEASTRLLDAATWSPASVWSVLAEDLRADIVVDLNGYTAGSMPVLYHWRPAPIVVSYMGYCGTQGSSMIDWFAGDAVATPPQFASRDFDERMLLLPDTYFAASHRTAYAEYRAPPRPLPAADRFASLVRLWEAEGAVNVAALHAARARALDARHEPVTLCSFASLGKLDPRTLALWLAVLRGTPDHVLLWLLHHPDTCVGQVREAARAAGVAPERVLFTHLTNATEFLTRAALCDLHLDTTNVATHTVATDVLFVGVPTLVRPRRRIASRVSASIVRAAGLERELVRGTDNAWVAEAIRVATDPRARAALQARVRAVVPSAPLFDAARWMAHWERGLRLLWDAHAHARAERPRRRPHVVVRALPPVGET